MATRACGALEATIAVAGTGEGAVTPCGSRRGGRRSRRGVAARRTSARGVGGVSAVCWRRAVCSRVRRALLRGARRRTVVIASLVRNTVIGGRCRVRGPGIACRRGAIFRRAARGQICGCLRKRRITARVLCRGIVRSGIARLPLPVVRRGGARSARIVRAAAQVFIVLVLVEIVVVVDVDVHVAIDVNVVVAVTVPRRRRVTVGGAVGRSVGGAIDVGRRIERPRADVDRARRPSEGSSCYCYSSNCRWRCRDRTPAGRRPRPLRCCTVPELLAGAGAGGGVV